MGSHYFIRGEGFVLTTNEKTLTFDEAARYCIETLKMDPAVVPGYLTRLEKDDCRNPSPRKLHLSSLMHRGLHVVKA